MFILDIFEQDCIFEIIGEQVYDLQTTIRALSNKFNTLLINNTEVITVDNEIICCAQGKGCVESIYKKETSFMMSAKIRKTEDDVFKMYHVKL